MVHKKILSTKVPYKKVGSTLIENILLNEWNPFPNELKI